MNVENIFSDFIGNESAITIIKRTIKYNLANNIHSGAIALFGPPSTGKTKLAKKIAQALGVPNIIATHSMLKDFHGLIIDKFETDYPDPCVIFIDEVHTLNRQTQDALLTAIENKDKEFRTKKGTIYTDNIFWIVASTDPGKLSNAFRSRFLEINLHSYSRQEIIKILKTERNKKRELGVVPEDALDIIATASKRLPRNAILILSQISKAISIGQLDPLKNSIQKELKETYGIDELGLTREDINYLLAVASNGQVGISFLTSILNENEENITKVIEPFLLQEGYINRTPKGRVITNKGMKALMREAHVKRIN